MKEYIITMIYGIDIIKNTVINMGNIIIRITNIIHSGYVNRTVSIL